MKQKLQIAFLGLVLCSSFVTSSIWSLENCPSSLQVLVPLKVSCFVLARSFLYLSISTFRTWSALRLKCLRVYEPRIMATLLYSHIECFLKLSQRPSCGLLPANQVWYVKIDFREISILRTLNLLKKIFLTSMDFDPDRTCSDKLFSGH